MCIFNSALATSFLIYVVIFCPADVLLALIKSFAIVCLFMLCVFSVRGDGDGCKILFPVLKTLIIIIFLCVLISYMFDASFSSVVSYREYILRLCDKLRRVTFYVLIHLYTFEDNIFIRIVIINC